MGNGRIRFKFSDGVVPPAARTRGVSPQVSVTSRCRLVPEGEAQAALRQAFAGDAIVIAIEAMGIQRRTALVLEELLRFLLRREVGAVVIPKRRGGRW
jgi:hypothetical protein